MTRLLHALIRDWPLKLAAVGLATLLYGGLVLSQSTQTFSGVIPVEPRDLPADAFLLTSLDPVTEVRYVSPSGVPPIASTFEAWVDLGSVPVGGGPVTVPIRLRAIDPRISIAGYSPDSATVELDPIATRQVDVQVRHAPPPEGLQVGDTVVTPSRVTVSGPASVVERVVAARADVVIQPSGISVDQEVSLIPVDADGNGVGPVNLDPPTVRVTIPVFEDLRSKSLPVTPVITGDPAPGFEIAAVSVEPSVVTVQGDAEALAQLTRVDTEAVSTNGASGDLEVDVELAVPAGILPVGVETVRVQVDLRPVTATRTFEVGLRLVGAQADRDYALSVDSVLVTLGGSTADLDRLSGATLVADLDVGGLESGSEAVPVTMEPPPGTTLVAVSPPEVTVMVTAQAATVSAAPSGSVPAASAPGGPASPSGPSPSAGG